jgi:hypothetical protein
MIDLAAHSISISEYNRPYPIHWFLQNRSIF